MVAFGIPVRYPLLEDTSPSNFLKRRQSLRKMFHGICILLLVGGHELEAKVAMLEEEEGETLTWEECPIVGANVHIEKVV